LKTLPNINILPTHTILLPVLNKEVDFSPFTVEHEKAIITALDGNDTNAVIKNYESVIKSCLKTELEWDSLSVVDYINLIIFIRAKSKGENIELRRESCSKCKEPFEFSINIEDAVKHKNVGCVKEVIELSNELSLEIAPLNYKFLYGLDKVKTEMDMYVHTAAYSISKVFWNNEIFIASPEDLKQNVIKNLRRSDLEKIFKKYADLATIYMEVEYKCPSCGEAEKEVINNFLKSLT